MYGAFTMESLLAAAFGRVVDVQKGEADEVTKAISKLFEFAKRETISVLLSSAQ